MSKELRIATLNAVAEQKKQYCLDCTDKAIAKLIKNNERISFGSVARVAGVSISYLYKYPEVKERIQNLREQQKMGVKKTTIPQSASEKSKQVIIEQFRNRINTLEWERKEQEKKIQSMTGKLYEMGRNMDLLDQLKEETSRLNQENKQLRAELESTRNELNHCQQRLITSNSKIDSFDQLRSQQATNDDISDELKANLSEVGIKLNKTLIQMIKSAPEAQVISALSVVKEALISGDVRSKAGLFRKALESAWEPNEADSEREASTTRCYFSQWYDLARDYGIVIGSREDNGVLMVQENTGQWHKFEDFSTKWTLDYLKRKQNRNR
ncbi:MAG: hypothetical protein DSM106950_15390 [Stigonema ocellatum SAG 48.90 = DSM 106950]|nr:hypothetical protein [Stigonema ocellatum SAG 48.90 = DSM 106950]